MLDSLLPLLGAGAAAFAASHAWQERQSPAMESYILAVEILPFAALLLAFLVDWESLALVRTYGSASLPILYRVSALWAGRAGPLLLWVALLALVRLWLRRRDELTGTSGMAMHAAMAILLILAALLRPFKLASSNAPRGEMNALLQTDLMVIHPPIVFLYYALAVAVAATVIEAWRAGRSSAEIHLALLRPARAALVVGIAGIGLGGLWAYTVLDWGGYWAWDPVETASLLPWLGCLFIVHLRITPQPLLDHTDSDRSAAARWGPPMGLIVGALAFHSTMVTRANGVWASVHAFVASGEGAGTDDAWMRVLLLFDQGVEGIEVVTEFAIFAGLVALAGFMVAKRRLDELQKADQATLLKAHPVLAGIVLAAVAAISIIEVDTALLAFGLLFATLLVLGDGKRPEGAWTAAGTTLMLLAAWSWHLRPELAFAGMAAFLAPWVLLAPVAADEEAQSGNSEKAEKKSESNSKLNSPAVHRPSPPILSRLPNLTRLIFWLPMTAGGAFIAITWLLLLSEIDGASLAAHEMYGAPLIALIAAGLILYSLRRALSVGQANLLTASLLIISVLFAWAGAGRLPGDEELILTGKLSRGAVARFLLVWLLFALAPMASEFIRASKEWWAARSAARASVQAAVAKKGRGERRLTVQLRRAAAQAAHLGILLLLIGHVMTTTLVARSDPIHQTTLILDEPVEHDGLILTMRDIELIERGDTAFDDRFAVGDAFVGIIVDVALASSSNGANDEIASRGSGATVAPGMLRFDSESGRISARSEVARIPSLTGDSILILDASQANDLMSRSILGELDEVERVRITVYNLPGSHLVWLGWILIVIASGVILWTDGKAAGDLSDDVVKPSLAEENKESYEDEE